MVMAWPVWAMHIGIVCECMEFWRFWREGTRGSPWISVWERSIYIDIQISVIINEFVVHAVFWFAPLFFWGPVVFDILVGVSAFKSSISDAAGQGLLWVLRKLIWPCWKLVGEWSPTHMQLTYVNNYVCVIIMCINLYVVYIYLSYIYMYIDMSSMWAAIWSNFSFVPVYSMHVPQTSSNYDMYWHILFVSLQATERVSFWHYPWYRLQDIGSTQYLCCMNPTAGSFTVNERLQRHFWTCSVQFPEQSALNEAWALWGTRYPMGDWYRLSYSRWPDDVSSWLAAS